MHPSKVATYSRYIIVAVQSVAQKRKLQRVHAGFTRTAFVFTADENYSLITCRFRRGKILSPNLVGNEETTTRIKSLYSS